MFSLLQSAVQKGYLRSIDIQLARMFAGDESPSIALAIAWLSYESGAGHVCLPVALLKKQNLFSGHYPDTELVEQIWLSAGTPTENEWRKAFADSMVIADRNKTAPFIFDNDCLYLQRIWLDEGVVATFFAQQSQPQLNLNSSTPSLLKTFLDALFIADSAAEVDWQKVAAAVAITRKVTIISGGPGTGKTTTVAKLLAALLQINEQKALRIALAAPTGKAAARLTESLAQASTQLPLNAAQKLLIPREASTLHRLLGSVPNSRRLIHNKENPLYLDVLIVDEASMIDLPMMAKLIAALPAEGRLILLGDRDQLASVEAGAMFGDLCRFAEQGYSEERAKELSQITGFAIPATLLDSPLFVRDNIALLRKSYRFDQQSGIGQLAQAVNQGNILAVERCFKQQYNDIALYHLKTAEDYTAMLQTCVHGYQQYLASLGQLSPDQVLLKFSQFQLLCALRDGPYGVEGLNKNIEQQLLKRHLINKLDIYSEWYVGRPVMITHNDYGLGLYNGDIGIALLAENKELRVFFLLSDGAIKSVQPSRLSSCITAFAMTVHKSQGSEFDHTILVLPNTRAPLLTRELVYTAITRARKKLTLFANQDILAYSIDKITQRYSGLAERLLQQGDLVGKP